MVKLCIKIADIIHYNIPHHLAHSLYHPMKPPSNNYLLPDLSFSRSFTADKAACVLRSKAPSREYLPAALAMYALWSGNFPVGKLINLQSCLMNKYRTWAHQT